MLIRNRNYVLDVDVEATRDYYKEHSLCDCGYCRNFYQQANERLPKLCAFLSELGADVSRPDEMSACANGDHIDYTFVAYTVVGEISQTDQYELDIQDGGMLLNILIDNEYVPNQQKSENYFVVNVSGIRLPWVMSEPPEVENAKAFWDRIKNFFVKPHKRGISQ